MGEHAEPLERLAEIVREQAASVHPDEARSARIKSWIASQGGVLQKSLEALRKSRIVHAHPLKTPSGKVVIRKQHSDRREAAKPKPAAAPRGEAIQPGRNTTGLKLRAWERLVKVVESGQAEITKTGRKYAVRTRPQGNSRYSRLGEYSTLGEALLAVADKFGIQASGKAEKTYQDVGKKVGGARKDIAAASGKFINNPTVKTLAKLEKEDPDAARRQCVRKTIWAPSLETYQQAGRDALYCAVALTVHASIPAGPPSVQAADRMNYFRAVELLRDLMDGAESFEAAVDILRGMQSDLLTVARWNRAEQWHAKHGTTPSGIPGSWHNEEEPTAYQRELATVMAQVPGFLDLLDGTRKKGFSIADFKATQDFVSGKHKDYGYYDGGYRMLTPDESRSVHNNLWATMVAKAFGVKERKEAKPVPPVTEEDLPTWERTVPTEYERKGGPKITVRRPEEYLTRFGLRAVEFGNWMDHEDSRLHVDRCAEAFQDLADALGISSKDLSLNGRLALAFGARGTGRAAAHYEPGKVVINLTKLGGAGTLGHEWGHFLDHVMQMVEKPGASSFSAADSVTRDDKTPVGLAMVKIMRLCLFGIGPRALYRGRAEDPELTRLVERQLAKQPDPQAAMDALFRTYTLNQGQIQLVANAIYARTKAKELTVNDHRSEFYATSFERGGGKRNSYWVRNHELFARAFEMYLLDALKRKHRANNYMVGGFKDEDEPGIPYPRGAERAAITAAFDELIEAVKSTGLLKKALAAMAGAPVFAPGGGTTVFREFTPPGMLRLRKAHGKHTDDGTLAPMVSQPVRKAVFASPFPFGKPAGERMTVAEAVAAIRQAIATENEATAQYQALADKGPGQVATRVFASIADEERTHIGELEALLHRLAPNEAALRAKGAHEVRATQPS